MVSRIVKDVLCWQWRGLPKDWFVIWVGGTTNTSL